MHVWLAEATARQRTVLVTRYDPYDKSSSASLVLAFSVSGDRCTLSLLSAADLEWSSMQRLSSPNTPLLGLLGMIKVGNDIFIGCVTSSERVGCLQRGQWVGRVRGVAFYCVTRTLYDEDMSLGVDPQDYGRGGASAAQGETPCASIRKYIASGSFYFAEKGAFDMTQHVARITSRSDVDESFRSQFAWNAYMMEPILEFRSRLDTSQRSELDKEALLSLVIQGYVGMTSVPLGPDRASKGTLAVISRLSSRKAGTRFNARGIDDQGNSANFAETETVLAYGDELFSYVQLRGSVPIFWEQQGLQALNARIQITRTGAASQPAFDQHMEQLLNEYGRVFVLDLLGTRDAEVALSQAYVQHIENLLPNIQSGEENQPLRYHNFDFHTIAKATGGLDGARAELDRLNNVQLQRQHNGYTLVRLDHGRLVRLAMQQGVFRVNCFDCLDRTNVVQGCLSHAALREFFREIKRDTQGDARGWLGSTPGLPEQLWPQHGRLWAENGDALSQISTGTGSLNSDYMRTGTKKSFTGLLSDAAKSASRMYMNNFQDQSKQQAIDTLLGTRSGQSQVQLYDPLYAAVDEKMARRRDEYASKKRVHLFVGTYNVCAQPAHQNALGAWFDEHDVRKADVIVLSFQEIVPLTAQQMLSSAAEPMRQWEAAVLSALNRGTTSYMVLRCELQFATSLLVLVHSEMLPHVRNVEATSKKTGFRGMSGNKGGVAVRMDVFDTEFCFVGAHLAAGNSNVDERNADYQSIARGIQFPRGRTIDSHTHVFWAGDLNYRFDQLSSDEVRALCAELTPATYEGEAPTSNRVLDKLYAHDQLKSAQASKAAFAEYNEAPLLFRPTYKYDVHTDTYDSSEKARAPAWTDRILCRSRDDALPLSIKRYGCADVRVSDHRPVFAAIDATAYAVDTAKRAEMRKNVLATMPGTPAQKSVLPRPSDELQQWWNDGTPLAPVPDTTPGNPFEAAPTRTMIGGPDTPAPPMPPRPRATAPSSEAPSVPVRPSGRAETAPSPGAGASAASRTPSEPSAPPPVPRRPDRP